MAEVTLLPSSDTKPAAFCGKPDRERKLSATGAWSKSHSMFIDTWPSNLNDTW
jgi:hypothetical protein